MQYFERPSNSSPQFGHIFLAFIIAYLQYLPGVRQGFFISDPRRTPPFDIHHQLKDHAISSIGAPLCGTLLTKHYHHTAWETALRALSPFRGRWCFASHTVNQRLDHHHSIICSSVHRFFDSIMKVKIPPLRSENR